MNILIAGASSGIGKYLSKHFDTIENSLYLTYHKHPENIFKTINPSFQYRCNFSDSLSVGNLYEKLPPLAVIINCMGHTENNLVIKMNVEEWDRVIESNLKTIFLSCKYGLSKIVDEGHIINISSVLGSMGMPGASNYCAAKGAVESFTKSFAQECLIKRKVFVNAISLGYFKIGMGLNIKPDIKNMIENRIPLGEFGDPSEIALAVNYIISSKYLSGHILEVNGGLWNS